ncbi:MAG: hypothetical protein IT178_13405 [Acidobacteria bacterium]|nr:hypothetical protein [Acidobacteriota bacterium]
MSDRKYRQRGYQDDKRERTGPGPSGPRPDREREPGAPAGARRISSDGARNPRMMGYRAVARCARCGTFVDSEILSRSRCGKCQQDLHACVQCTHFDPGARFECVQPLTARVAPKDIVNACELFEARTSWERETSAAAGSSPSTGSRETGQAPANSARKAFDDLFKF